ncbi:hypothetical protein MetMK1DRAFT_00000490 [Metallosphaera yellowstonensis MK1]|uniref:Uncharacterized protein n=1 Tax=Metallosphaera yellowstonensis MK1 TaxID=671065 RepID=H2C0H8_9CREN|nr:hypothetical protein [Metallosphaera yellowstonensis]EHP71240.1 hypothetical protein MetMK1DRAFT_00000490 [Metallosphaera yellowstonensis MK1]
MRLLNYLDPLQGGPVRGVTSLETWGFPTIVKARLYWSGLSSWSRPWCPWRAWLVDLRWELKLYALCSLPVTCLSRLVDLVLVGVVHVTRG